MAETSLPNIESLAKELGLTTDEINTARSLSPEQLNEIAENYLYLDSRSSPCPYQQAIRPVRDLVRTKLLEELRKPNAFAESSIFSPAAKAARLLRTINDQESKQLLLEHIASGNENAYDSIGQILVSYGSDDLLPTIAVLFSHPEDFPIVSSARAGVLDAAKNGCAEPQFKKYVWAYCLQAFLSKNPPSMYAPLRLMKALDSDALAEVSFMIAQDGLDVFFTNQLGVYSSRAIEALKNIGAKQHAKFFAKLIKLYGNGPWGDQGQVLDYMEQLSESTLSKIRKIEKTLGELPNPTIIAIEHEWRRQGGR